MAVFSEDRLDEILRELEKEKKRLEEKKKDVDKCLQSTDNEIFSVRMTKRLLVEYRPPTAYDQT